MEFLRTLESIRSPFLNAVNLGLSMLGEETLFIVMGMILLWCVNKKWGYRFLFVSFIGLTFNQLLKSIFHVSRPWVRDPSLNPVEAAIPEATGYSFPSGHTTNAVSVFGTLGLMLKKRWATIVCALLILGVGFSRMYLGVHTPADVGVALVVELATVFICIPLMERIAENRKPLLLFASFNFLLAVGVVILTYVIPAHEPAFDENGRQAAWTILGCGSALALSWYLDHTRIHFEVKAVWWAQVLKVVIGLAVVMGIRVGLKALLGKLMPDNAAAYGIRYFAMAAFAGIIWPMSFGWFSRLGTKQ